MERRRERRRRVLKDARIVSLGPCLSVSCIVREHSAHGVRLLIHTVMDVPQQFDLIFLGTSERKCARKVWQIGREVGAEFVEGC